MYVYNDYIDIDPPKIDTWEVTDFTQTVVSIKINWESSRNVSLSSNRDMLKVIIVNNSYFRMEGTDTYIALNSVSTKEIPTQLEDEAWAEVIGAVGLVAVNSMIGVMSFNLGI
mmetsp:Transcript_31722/g.31014  ORF Transcript_31722/g.31014 Transcript_31722/m.31014 type:complete len:113 (-) Transcript_31722:1464-1802(-)